jgi:hypothetical protein
MDNRQVDVPTLLQTIASQLSNSQDGIDQASSSTHGRRMAQAFRTAAEAAQEANTNDASEQLRRAAAAMRQRGQGVAAGFYADGLENAAAQVRGQSGISMNDLVPFLQSFVGGVEANNPAKPGQGTMLDALQPALGALQGAQSTGNTQGGILDALGAALSGARQTEQGGRMDPGAASAVNVIGGIIAAVAPALIGGLLSNSQGQGAGSGAGGLGGLVGGLLGGQQPQPGAYGTQPGGYGSPQGSADPFGGLGGLLGGLLGGDQGNASYGGYGTGQQPGQTGLGDVLDNLMGNRDEQGRKHFD